MAALKADRNEISEKRLNWIYLLSWFSVLILLNGILIHPVFPQSNVINECKRKACPTCQDDVCINDKCHYNGECNPSANSSGYVLGCSCNCTDGFEGTQCISSKMFSTYNDLNKTSLLSVQDAEDYAVRSQLILDDQINIAYKELSFSLNYSIDIGDVLVSKMQETLKREKNKADLNPLTEEVTKMTTFFLDGIRDIGCKFNDSGCRIPSSEVNDLSNRSESNIIRMVNLMLSTANYRKRGKDITINSRDRMSLNVLKGVGNDLPHDYQAKYGSISLPYWESVHDAIGNEEVNMNLLTYKYNPYVHLENLLDTVVGNNINNTNVPLTYAYQQTSPVVRIAVTDRKQEFVELEDFDDPLDVGIDMAELFKTDNYFQEMESLNSEEGKVLVHAAFNESVVEAYVVELKIDSVKKCVIWGKYGSEKVTFPDDDNYDIYINTKGKGKILKTIPRLLPVDFEDSILKITIHNNNFAQNEQAPATTFVLRCEDDFFDTSRRKKRQIAIGNTHKFRLSSFGGRCLNQERTRWLGDLCIQVSKVKGSEIMFKSNFFGTFSAQAFFIGPSPIRFEEIFLNFWERLADAPHVLATFVGVIVIVTLLIIPLRRADIQDKLNWSYLPILDNPMDGFRYYLSFQTSTNSEKFMSAGVFMELKGLNGTTGPRILADGIRKNFTKGTSTHFVLVTENRLGPLKKLLVWHDNTGKSPRWLLSKVVIVDGQTFEKHVFFCGKWLSLDCEDGKTWRRLYPTTFEILDRHLMFEESSRRRFYDDFLWFSLSRRPHFSRFSRVQRLWTLTALLFLSMLCSAMWYEQGQSTENISSSWALKIGPLTLSYRQFYVGIMSSIIVLLPSFVIITIFKRRKFRNERNWDNGTSLTAGIRKMDPFQKQHNLENCFTYDNNDTKSLCGYINENTISTKGKSTKKTVRMNEKEPVIASTSNPKAFQFPWWTIFFSYFFLILCILSGGSLTFFYSLQFGREKTNDWFMSFIFGTMGSIFIIEPVKALGFAAVVACFLQKSVEKEIKECPIPTKDFYETTTDRPEYSIFPCPQSKTEALEIKVLRHRAQLDRILVVQLRSWFLKSLYVIMVLFITSHNFITQAYRQNTQLNDAMKSSFQANSTNDIWDWIETYYIPAIWTKINAAEKVRKVYDQRYLFDHCSFRLGLTRIRQVRTTGQCDIDPLMKDDIQFCYHDYSRDHEATHDFCKDWNPYNVSCFDEDEETDYAFLYQNSTDTKSLPHFGYLATYDGGGYILHLGPKQSLAYKYIDILRNYTWIDQDTRAVFLDTNSFNPNTRLFSHIKVVFELTNGLILCSFTSKSSNLYPYVSPIDYIVLAVQGLFCICVGIKIVIFFVSVYNKGIHFYKSFITWCQAFELVCCLTAPVCYALRIVHTINAIEEIRNDKDLYVSFDYVELFDQIYYICMACVSFIAILDLLTPLTFNFYVFILHRTLITARSALLSYMVIVIIVIIAFGCYLSFTVGHQAAEFKDIFTSSMTLMQLLLAMITFRGNLRLHSLQVEIVLALYTIAITMILVNIFITTLTITFDEIKKAQSNNDVEPVFIFNEELNSHLWIRLHQLITSIFRKCFPQKKVVTEDLCEKYAASLTKVIDRFDNLHYTACKGEKDTTLIVYKYAMAMYKEMTKHRVLLQCVAIRVKQETCYRNYSPLKCLQEKFSNVCSNYYEFQTPTNIKLKGDAFFTVRSVNQTENPSKAIYTTDMKNWIHVKYNKTQNAFNLKEIPLYMVCVPDNDLENDVPIKIPIQENMPKLDVVLEKHHIPVEGSSFSLSCDPRVQIVVKPLSVNSDCSLEIGKQFIEDGSPYKLFMKPSLNFQRPIQIRFPSDGVEYNNKEIGDLLILSRWNDSEWSSVNSVLDTQDGNFKFMLRGLKANVAVQLFVKKSEIGWVKDPHDYRDTKMMKVINLVCRYPSIAKQWMKVAEHLDVKLDPTKKGEDLRIEAWTKNNKNVPLSCEEKCFFILYKWYQQHPNADVSTFRKVVADIGFKQVADLLYRG